ncbi:antitoxin Xre/MbcA/ParS toxin-binding domain-containing protein [Brenneria populi subsp. brevivirga]|uniref:type II RES/Xre toxin-antitoxin system antitoxin n=1 Tax=Brenneria populi TaxID=1505588 RepID=UPI002E180B40|nr:antitoxin Xre/MbcA/ParS toxin-binding domain-containing protein [Brenneria populi subsp. brevivirga]
MTTSIFTPQSPAQAQKSLMASLNLPEVAVDAHDRITQGLDVSLLKDMAALIQLDEQQLYRMAGIDRTTYNRRVKSAERRFSPEQSARIYLLARTIAAASQLFNGDSQRMAQWLNKPAKGLAGKKPADLLSTPTGAEAVLTLIGQIEYGVIS